VSAKYRAFLTPRGSGQDLLEVPTNGLQYSWTLDNAGAATISDMVSTAEPISGDHAARLDSWAAELLLVRDDGPGTLGPVWWGPIKAPSGTADTKRVTINAVDSAQWFNRRGWTTDLDLSGWDSANAARHCITAKTTALGPAGDLGIDLEPSRSGMKGPNVLKASDRLRLFAVVDQCGQVGDGFDWAIVPSQDPDGTYRRTWRIYPGGRGITIDRVLTTGRGGLRDFARGPAGDGVATRVYHPVTDQQGNTSYGYAQADAGTELRYGIHEFDDEQGDAPGNDGAAAARATLAYRRPPVQIVSFSYRVSDAMPLGMLQPGDSVPLRVEGTGWPDYAGTVRVIGVNVNVDDNGEELVNCSVQAPPGGIS
jgi:hypothetical protein